MKYMREAEISPIIERYELAMAAEEWWICDQLQVAYPNLAARFAVVKHRHGRRWNLERQEA